jgi:hypothetical protein
MDKETKLTGAIIIPLFILVLISLYLNISGFTVGLFWWILGSPLVALLGIGLFIWWLSKLFSTKKK